MNYRFVIWNKPRIYFFRITKSKTPPTAKYIIVCVAPLANAPIPPPDDTAAVTPLTPIIPNPALSMLPMLEVLNFAMFID